MSKDVPPPYSPAPPPGFVHEQPPPAPGTEIPQQQQPQGTKHDKITKIFKILDNFFSNYTCDL